MSGTSDAAKALTATSAKTNLIRLSRLLITGGTRVLRQVLDKIHPPATLDTVLAQPPVEKELKKRLAKPFRDILYPSPGTYGKSENFDVTILSWLFSIACNLPAPATGWNNEPPQADVSLSDDLVRIKLRRNKIYAHTGEKMEMQNKEFVTAWDELKGILTRLAGFVSAANATEWGKAIDEMMIAPLTDEEERNVDELKKWYLQDIEIKQKLEDIEGNLSNKVDEVLSGHKMILSKIDEMKTASEKQQQTPKVPKLPPGKLELDTSPTLRDLSLEVDFNMEEIGAASPAGTESEKGSSERPSLTFREYHKELAEDALQGKNCIICAPTGSGKTIVALYIAWKHLQERETKEISEQETGHIQKRGKVIFVVDRIHLTTQQQKQFQKYLPREYSVANMSSDISGKLENRLDNYDVTVSTAQILADALRDGRVKLSDISLLIIDECHHTDSEHPYNQIMSHYLSVKLQSSTSAVSTSSKLPQVVGLSASLGVGKSQNVSAAAAHIIYICSTMDAQKLCTVERNKEELQRYSSAPKVTLHKVVKSDYDKFEGAINDVMNKIEKVIEYSVPGFKTNDRAQQSYRNWIESACVTAFGNRYLMTCLQHLREYHIALNIAEVSRMKDSLKYLLRYFQGLDESKFEQIDTSLKYRFETMRKKIEDYMEEHGEPPNPKLEKIKQLIIQYHEEDGNSRGILFTKTRESTLALESWIKETEGLEQINAARIIGTGGDEASLTPAERDKTIQDFDKGDVNLLIATTVAEEGLDIAECSYVIRLNMPGNEISTAQAQGRVRTQHGRYDVIAGDLSGLVEKEKLNLSKGLLMMKAVDCVKEMECGDFLRKVKSNQLKLIQQRAIKLQQRKVIRSQFQPEDITFYCKKCGNLACQAHDFRLFHDHYYVVVTQDILKRATIKPHHKPWRKDIEVNEKVYCADCGEDWGIMATIDSGISLPCLKIQSFVLKMKDGSRRTIKQWSKAPFEVAPVEFSDMFLANDDMSA